MISIADKKFRGRDKIVQKMTKDGLVDENLRTGEQKSVATEEKPEQEDSVKETAEKETDEETIVEEERCMDAGDGEEDAPRHHSTAKQSADYYKAHQEDGKPKDAPAEADVEPQTKKGRLSFEDEKGGIVRGVGMGVKKVAKKGVDTATEFAHQKVHQVEKDNSGVEAAHKSEEAAERLHHFVKGRKKPKDKQAIHEAIADNYDGMYLGDGAVDQVVRQYGMERVGYILANTLHHKSYDGRFSHSNKEWAEQVSTPEHNADRMTFRTDWVVDSHPTILDGFVTMFRKELETQKEQEQPFVKQFYVVENLQAAPLKIERFGNLDDAMSQYQALPNHYMKALGVEKNPDPLPGSLDILQCRNGIDTIVEDYKTVPGWDNPYIQNHVVQPLQGALAVQDMELAYELPDAYFHIQTCDDGFDYTLYNKDFTERDGGILETDGDKSVQEVMTELLTEFGCNAEEGKVMDAAELREQADMVAEQQAEVLKEKLAAERPAPEETLSFYVAECLEFTFAGEFHDHLTMEEALEAYDKIPSERMNADKCIGFCIEEDGGFVGMYELVVNDKVQRENINSINYFRDDKLVQQAIFDMEKLMAARQQSKEQERGSTKKSVLDALRSLKAKKQEQPAQEQDKPKKAKKKGMEL